MYVLSRINTNKYGDPKEYAKYSIEQTHNPKFINYIFKNRDRIIKEVIGEFVINFPNERPIINKVVIVKQVKDIYDATILRDEDLEMIKQIIPNGWNVEPYIIVE